MLRQIYTNDGGPLPFPAADALGDDFPILAVWGDQDKLAPMTGEGMPARPTGPSPSRRDRPTRSVQSTWSFRSACLMQQSPRRF